MCKPGEGVGSVGTSAHAEVFGWLKSNILVEETDSKSESVLNVCQEYSDSIRDIVKV